MRAISIITKWLLCVSVTYSASVERGKTETENITYAMGLNLTSFFAHIPPSIPRPAHVCNALNAAATNKIVVEALFFLFPFLGN